MNHLLFTALLFISVSTAVGCDASTTQDDSLDRPVNELSSDELMERCDLRDQITDLEFEKVTCYLHLIQQEEEEGALCEWGVEDCIADPPQATAFLTASWACVLPDEGPELPSCAAEVTAGELDECYADRLTKFRLIEASITCDFDTEDPSNDVNLVSSCLAIEERCPGLLDSL